MDIKVKILSDKAKLPEYKTPGSSGMDVCSTVDYRLMQMEVKAIPTGLSFELPVGYEIQVRPRSGLAAKNKITVLNTPGTLDQDYRGELMIILVNFGTDGFDIKVGDRIAQIVVCPVVQAHIEVVNELDQTKRGAGGLGSTGV